MAKTDPRLSLKRRSINMLNALIALCILSSTACLSESPAFTTIGKSNEPSLVSKQVKSKLGKGVNLSWWFAQHTNYTWKMLTERVTQKDFEAIKTAGFTHVRIPIEPESLDYNPKTRKFNSMRLGFLQQNLESISKLGLFILIDYHPRAAKQEKLKGSPEQRQEIIHFWEDLIKGLKVLPPDKIAFEAYNEPNLQDDALWATFQEELLTAMRSVAPDHTLLATAQPWSSVIALEKFKPFNDKNIIYVFHYYDPMVVSHQGASWSPMTNDINGLEYPYNRENALLVRATISNPNTLFMLDNFIKEQWNASSIEADMRRIRNWADNHQVDIMCTEFGCVNRADEASRSRLISDIRTSLEKYNIPWSFWDYGSPMGISLKTNHWENIDSRRLKDLGMPKSKFNP